MIYLDNNATTPVDPRVLEEMIPYYSEHYGNPSSIHSLGRKAKAALDISRDRVSKLINASPREIMFTSGGSEGNNYAIKGIAFSGLREKGNHVITTNLEHESVLDTYRYLENNGYEVTYLNVNKEGLINLDELRDALTDETILVSCIYANNETGTIMPISEIAEIVKSKGAILHTDAVQAVGKISIDLNEIPVDILTMSAHKIYGPKGSGAVYIRSDLTQETPLTPLIHGGGQERGRRSGTENVAGIMGLGMACELARSEMSDDRERVGKLRDELFVKLVDLIDGVSLNGSPDSRLWNTLNLSFEGVNGGSLSMNLDLEGVAVSTGSACSEGKVGSSHVLAAMGCTQEQAASSVRLSLGRFTTEEDVEIASGIISRAVKRIRKVK